MSSSSDQMLNNGIMSYVLRADVGSDEQLKGWQRPALVQTVSTVQHCIRRLYEKIFGIFHHCSR